jgi:hypothetical protein
MQSNRDGSRRGRGSEGRGRNLECSSQPPPDPDPVPVLVSPSSPSFKSESCSPASSRESVLRAPLPLRDPIREGRAPTGRDRAWASDRAPGHEGGYLARDHASHEGLVTVSVHQHLDPPFVAGNCRRHWLCSRCEG